MKKLFEENPELEQIMNDPAIMKDVNANERASAARFENGDDD